jgi:hypothetical protein
MLSFIDLYLLDLKIIKVLGRNTFSDSEWALGYHVMLFKLWVMEHRMRWVN